MHKAEQLLATIAIATAAAIFCSGCPALMIPGLAYSGYKYEHDKNQPAASASSTSAPSSKSTTAQSGNSTDSPQRKIPDSEME
jgi:hypothetical protein